MKRNRKPRASYRRYNFDQIEKFFELVIEEGKTAKEAALKQGYQHKNCSAPWQEI
jgi:hypothetical protein